MCRFVRIVKQDTRIVNEARAQSTDEKNNRAKAFLSQMLPLRKLRLKRRPMKDWAEAIGEGEVGRYEVVHQVRVRKDEGVLSSGKPRALPLGLHVGG
jgi:hypothetical protein